ncbi:MAG: DUF2493 domain-containing protein [Acidobacteria bacterium]|nr:DUF2493 domain-containing protein [Acidobacteriota bacterium]
MSDEVQGHRYDDDARNPVDEGRAREIKRAGQVNELKFRNAPTLRSKKGNPAAQRADQAVHHLEDQRKRAQHENRPASRQADAPKPTGPAADIQAMFGTKTVDGPSQAFPDMPPNTSTRVQSTTVATEDDHRPGQGDKSDTAARAWCGKNAEPIGKDEPIGDPEDEQTRVVVTGSRDYTNRFALRAALSAVQERATGELVIFHGASRGADRMAGQWAEDNRVEVSEHAADWDTHGKTAGMIRNQQMFDIADPHLVIAFPSAPGSRGTEHMVELASGAGCPVEIADSFGRTYEYDRHEGRIEERVESAQPQRESQPRVMGDEWTTPPPQNTADDVADIGDDPGEEYIEVDDDAPEPITASPAAPPPPTVRAADAPAGGHPTPRSGSQPTRTTASRA